MLLPPLKISEHAVNDINRKSCPHWRKAVAPPLVLWVEPGQKLHFKVGCSNLGLVGDFAVYLT